MARINSFKSIIDDHCHTIILGTIPGKKSLHAKEYYANPNNYFWDIIFRVFNNGWGIFDYIGNSVDYDSKKELLYQNGIGLWDVIESCEREGSSDKKIKNEILNDFDDFFRKHRKIKKIIFNGKGREKKSAFQFFKKEYSYHLNDRLIFCLNSTSSQNPNNPFMILNEWHKALRQ